MELSGYGLERLRDDPDFTLYRGRGGLGARPILLRALSPRADLDGGLALLEHELALAEDLDPAWALRPFAMTHVDGRAALVMVDPGGQPLDRLLGAPLELGRFLGLALAAAVALRGLHARGLIHKDIRPANLWIDTTSQVRVSGFGFATLQPRERQAPAPPEILAGNLAYMAPEQTGRMNRPIDNRSDLYALGVTFYEMLVGSLPFVATDPMEWVHCHIARLPPPPSVRVEGVPPVVEAIILKLLAKNAEDRYQTAAGLEFDLRRCMLAFAAHKAIEPFVLAERDASDRLMISGKLYGREVEAGLLKAAFEKVATDGKFEFLLVTGYSGVGKSAVVSELNAALHTTRGLFAVAKFDQYKRDIPYASLAEAFRGLLRQVLSKDDADLERWRAALLQALGTSGQLMVDLIPELGVILGEQPKPHSLSAQDEKARFHLIFRRFLQVFARADHPLILFLDDLQWLDAATLELLERLSIDEESPYLLLIGAYRSNELDATQGFGRSLETIRTARGELRELQLKPLTPRDVAQLIADTLRAELASVIALATLVYRKTRGNPFFVAQFLTTLHVDGLLVFDLGAGAWRWDLEQIRSRGITDNVAELMARKLTRYKDMPLAVIKALACLGNETRTETLSRVLGVSEAEVHRALRDIVGADLVHRTAAGYAFAHDGVRDAAYGLIPEAERAAAHLRIGRLLSEDVSPKALEDVIFEIVNQFNRGAGLVQTPAERLRLAELNLIAGKRAKASAAYQSAQAYLTTGCDLLPINAWEDHYRTTFELRFHQADCRFMTGDTDFAGAHFAILAERSQDMTDLTAVVGRQMVLQAFLGDMRGAILTGLNCLEKMGEAIPEHPTDREVEEEFDKFIAKVGDREISSLFDEPDLDDVHYRNALALFEELLGPGSMGDPNFLDMMLLRMANIGINQGFSDESTHAFANLGARVFGWRFGQFEQGHQFGQLAMRLIEDRGYDRHAARVYAIISGIVAPWSQPLRESHAIALRAIELPRERGGLSYAGYAWTCAITALLDSGKSLPEVHRLAEIGLEFAQKSNFTLVIQFITTQLDIIRELRGLVPENALFGETTFADPEREAFLSGTPSLWHAHIRYQIRKLQVLFHAGRYDECLPILVLVGGNLGESPILCSSPVFEVVEYCFYSALARAASLTDRPAEDWEPDFLALRTSAAQLADWAQRCPANFADRSRLVAAEIARLEGRELDAQRLYEDAIGLSREQGFIQNEAMACELAGVFYEARGFKTISEAYLRKARAAYARWGAHGKVGQLDRRFASLDDDDRALESKGRAARFEHLDLPAVLEMHQLVSRELVLDRLIEQLMVTMVEHAGAVRGLLLLPKERGLRIAAEATTQEATVKVDLRSQAKLAGELPQTVLNYVLRTHEAVIVDDALAPNPYASDSYFAAAKIRSALCLPLVKQGRVVGVLYLENGLSAHIFTPARLAALQLLASQAAISLENAELFLDAQDAKNEARRVGDELKRSFDMIPALAWRASAEGVFEFANKRWHDYTGVAADDPNFSDMWIGSFHPDDAERVASVWMHLLEFGASGEVEGRIRRFDGEYRSFLVRATPMRDEAGRIVMWHGTNTDIEELKRAEQAQEALARVSRVTAMGELTVSIAHEVNQPLMAIVTNAATCLMWLEEERFNLEEARLAAQRIIRAGHRAGDVIASIRALAKKSPPQTVALNLNDAVTEVLMLTRNELDRHAITVEADLSPDLDLARADQVQMQQVILNLVINGIEAISASSDPYRVIRIRSEREGPGFVQISVSDSGIGLGAGDQERIFEAFYTTKTGGVGMGLSICRSIVESHGGRLWAGPNTPSGTIFKFSIPTFTEETPAPDVSDRPRATRRELRPMILHQETER